MLISFLTHHKCASSALYDYVVELARLNRLTIFASHVGSTEMRAEYDVCFSANAEYPYVKGRVTPPSLHLVRNPLNLVQSAYYSHKISHSLEGWPELARQREALLKMSVEEGMLSTAKFCNSADFYADTAGPLYAINNWDFDDRSITTARIEDHFDRFTDAIRAQFPRLALLLTWPDQAAFSFARYSGGRPAGVVDDSSHYRSGRLDAWEYELPESAADYVRRECREVLERFYPECL